MYVMRGLLVALAFVVLLSQLILHGRMRSYQVGEAISASSLQPQTNSSAIVDRPSRIRNNDTEPICYRKCKNYNNLIVFNPEKYAGKGRGLNDRDFVMARTANLGAYLCAKVVIPSPYLMLSPDHNHGERVSSDLTWDDDFFTYNFLSNHEPALLQADNATSLEQPFLQCQSKGRHIFLSKRNKQLLSHFNMVRKWPDREAQCPFLWKIERSYWDAYDKLLTPEMEQLSSGSDGDILPNQCTGVYQAPSPLLNSMVDQVVKEIPSRDFGYLHLRRGDTIDVCKTTVEKVREYLSCSIGGRRLGVPLVLSTEEQSKDYIQSIRQVALDLGFSTFLHLDNMIQEKLQAALPKHKLNNHLTFAIVNQVAKRASFRLERRRHIACNDCDAQVIDVYLRERGIEDGTGQKSYGSSKR